MKIAESCIYWYHVTSNFIMGDLEGEEWKKFLGARKNPKEKIEIIKPYKETGLFMFYFL